MTGSLHIRRYHSKDCAEIMQLIQAAVAKLARAHYSQHQIAAWNRWPESEAQLRLSLAAGEVWVAIKADRVAGVCQRAPQDYIQLLYVHPEFARQGIGSTLLQQAIKSGEQSGVVRFATHASRTSRRLFEQHGFEVLHSELVNRYDGYLERFAMLKALPLAIS
ncbi:MAG: GNAT family N-acetyltransferase [Gammaproteobacteria bacterium]|nr:GNAT family N-acetyltransferase [Gammaproteobacteria bacterium]